MNNTDKRPITKCRYMVCMMKFQEINYLNFFREKSPKLTEKYTKFSNKSQSVCNDFGIYFLDGKLKRKYLLKIRKF